MKEKGNKAALTEFMEMPFQTVLWPVWILKLGGDRCYYSISIVSVIILSFLLCSYLIQFTDLIFFFCFFLVWQFIPNRAHHGFGWVGEWANTG